MVGNSASILRHGARCSDDKKAYAPLQRLLRADFARGFKLYKLYERAAGLTGQPAQ